MAKTQTFQCSIVTPERVVLDCQARSVVFPAHDGELGVLRDRAPLVCRMGIGIARVEGEGGERDYYVDGGFAQVVRNQLTILTERAREAKDVDRAAAEKAMVEARAMKIPDDAAFDARQKALKRAEVQLKLVKR